jgi:hypothetical protein
MSIPGSASSNQTQIQKWIQQKTSFSSSHDRDRAFITPASYLATVNTDVNELPYPRFFRGRALSSTPYIFDREAGFQNVIRIIDPPTTSPIAELATTDMFCFQPPCGTIFPCKPNPANRMNAEPVSISP